MDWQTILSIAGIVFFVIFMMRGCGGMMGGGGCGMGGMGSRRPIEKGDARETKNPSVGQS